MFQFRRAAVRLLSSPSTSSIIRSRSITSISHSAFKTSRQSTAPFLQKRWASDEAAKVETTELKSEKSEEVLESKPIESKPEEPAAVLESEPVESKPEEPVQKVEASEETASTLAQSTPAAGSDRATIYVGNLFFDVHEKDLASEFKRFGEIENAIIVRDGKGLSKGFGYVHFKNHESAINAIEQMNQTVYEGRRISIQLAKRNTSETRFASQHGLNPPSATLFIGNMPWDMTDKDLNELFKGVKNVIDVRVAIDRRTGQPRGFAHAEFIDTVSAVEAQKILAERMCNGRRLRVDYSQPHSTFRGKVQDSRSRE